MSLGYDREPKLVNLGDTANLTAVLYDTNTDEPVPVEDLVSVTFTIQAPDKTQSTVTGTIEEDGMGVAYYDDTEELGHYPVVAAFVTLNGTQSVRADFETVDPFLELEPSLSWVVANDAWEKFEDCFDGEEEGPWLRDMTLNIFNKKKMENFIDDALMDINLQHPPTSLGIESFVQAGEKEGEFVTTDLPVLTQGLVLQLIRHLMRSYAEQPNPVGAQIAWHDRRDYLQRWKEVYLTEQEQYKRMLALYKRRYLGLGTLKTIVASKAGRLLPAPMRTRNVGRGYW
jgi:hypothetical protein